MNIKAKVSILIVFSILSASAASGMTVNLGNWGNRQITTYNPPPPTDLEGHSGDATAIININPTYDRFCSKDGKQVKVANLNIELSGHTNIRLPAGYSQSLFDHEKGHDTLFKFEFMRYVKKKVERAYKGFERVINVPKGKTCDDVLKDIKKEDKERAAKAKEAIKGQNNTLSVKYDSEDFTDHGNKTTPTAEDAAQQVINEKLNRELERKRLNKKLQVTDCGVAAHAKMMKDGDIILSNPPQVPVLNLDDLGDPINDSGKLTSDYLVPIGTEDGEDTFVWISDTTVEISDVNDPNILYLQAALIQVNAYDSIEPGYAGEIAGLLDIYYINNSIGSPFLARMEQAMIENEYAAMWFFGEEQMFDEEGNWTGGTMGVEGDFIIGIGQEEGYDSSEDFEYFDPAMFDATWMPGGNGMTFLEEAFGYNSEKSMRLELNNEMPPYFSEVFSLYPELQDWSQIPDSTVDIAVNLSDPNLIYDMYIEISDIAANSKRFVMSEPAAYGYIRAMGQTDNWQVVSVDIREFSGIVTLSEVSSVKIGFGNGIEESLSGIVFVDAIGVSEPKIMEEFSADLNKNDRVDIFDLALFADQWLSRAMWP